MHCGRREPTLGATVAAKETARWKCTGERRIPAPRQRVWEGLNDPEILKQCIPGCETHRKGVRHRVHRQGRRQGRAGQGDLCRQGDVVRSRPAAGYTISGEGTGGVAGFAKGGAKVDLDEDGGETVLRYAVQAQVGGKLAQIGSRLIDGTARKMADDFFDRFAAAVTPETAPLRSPSAAV